VSGIPAEHQTLLQPANPRRLRTKNDKTNKAELGKLSNAIPEEEEREQEREQEIEGAGAGAGGVGAQRTKPLLTKPLYR
jgi:hypothetical protein